MQLYYMAVKFRLHFGPEAPHPSAVGMSRRRAGEFDAFAAALRVETDPKPPRCRAWAGGECH